MWKKCRFYCAILCYLYLCYLVLVSFLYFKLIKVTKGFPGGSDGKESACNEGDLGSIPGSGSSPGERNRNPLQHSCLENSMDRGAWWATVHGSHKESDMTEQVSTHAQHNVTRVFHTGVPTHIVCSTNLSPLNEC